MHMYPNTHTHITCMMPIKYQTDISVHMYILFKILFKQSQF